MATAKNTNDQKFLADDGREIVLKTEHLFISDFFRHFF